MLGVLLRLVGRGTALSNRFLDSWCSVIARASPSAFTQCLFCSSLACLKRTSIVAVIGKQPGHFVNQGGSGLCRFLWKHCAPIVFALAFRFGALLISFSEG